MDHKVTIDCPTLGEIDVSLQGSRVIKFPPFWKSNSSNRGGTVLSTPCPCCKFSHFSPINEEQKSKLLAMGVQVTNFNFFGQANVPVTWRNIFRNGENIDLEKIMKKDLKVLYGPNRRRFGMNGRDPLASTIDKWAKQYGSQIARSMQQRTRPMSWRSIDSR